MWRLSLGRLTARTIWENSYIEKPNRSLQYDGGVDKRVKSQISMAYWNSKGIKKETMLNNFSYHVAFWYSCVILPGVHPDWKVH